MLRSRSRSLGAEAGAASGCDSGQTMLPPTSIPPPLPFTMSLSEAAMAIGLDISEATEQLSGVPMTRSRSSLGPPPPSPSQASGSGRSPRLRLGSKLQTQTSASPSGSLPPVPPYPVGPATDGDGLASSHASDSAAIQGNPMRRTRSRGPPNKMDGLSMSKSSSISGLADLVSSFIASNPAIEEEGEDILQGWNV